MVNDTMEYNVGRHRQELLDRIKLLDGNFAPPVVQLLTQAKSILKIPMSPAPAPAPIKLKVESEKLKVEPKPEIRESVTEIPKQEITPLNPPTRRDVKPAQRPDKIIYGLKGSLYLGGEIVPMTYAIVELDDVITSNDPFTFSKNPRYPESCQNRSYKDDKNEQTKLLRNEKNYDPTFVIVPSPDGVNGPPVVSPEMYVLGGNSRAMTQKRLKANNPDYHKLYTDYLREKSECDFNIPRSDLDAFENPTLVRIIDVDMQKCSRYSNLLQKGQTEVFDHVRQGLAYGSQLMEDKESLKVLANIFENGKETIAATLADKDSRDRIIRLMRKAELLRDDNRGEWLESISDEFSDSGKLLMTSTLLSMILDERKYIESLPSFTNNVAANILIWIKINDLPDEWNLVPVLKDVIDQENTRRLSGDAFKSPSDVINQTRIGVEPIPIMTVYLWFILFYLNRQKQKQIFSDYLNSAHNEGSTEANMFEAAIQRGRPIDVLREYAQRNLSPELNKQLESYKKDNALSGLGLAALPTAKQIIHTRYKEKPLKLDRTEKLFGNLLDNAKVFVYGNPGNGKSTFVLMLADDLAANGKVLYVMTEERIGARFQERLKWKKIFNKNIEFLTSADINQIVQYIASGRYQFVIIDSHNKLNAKQEDVIKLMEQFPDKGFVFVSRNLKNKKDFAGSGNWSFDVDTVVKLENGIATLEKKHRDRNDTVGVRQIKVVNYT